jgi:uncharacterized protein
LTARERHLYEARVTTRRMVGLMVLATIACGAPGAPAAETARQILDRRKALDDGARHWTDRHQRLRFRILDKRQTERTRDLELYEKRYPGDERKTIVFFLTPPEVKGTAFLAFTHKGKPGDQWLYLPALQRVRQITASARTESFVGTDLTYRDLDILSEMVSWTEDDAASSLRTDEAEGGVPCHVIELAPKRDDIGYKKIVLWLGTDDLVPRKLEFYEDGSTLTKRLVQSAIHDVGAIPVADATRVDSVAAGTSTDIAVSATEFDQKLADDFFTERSLEQGPQ